MATSHSTTDGEYQIDEDVLALIPDIGGFRLTSREETLALRDKVLARSEGIRRMEENCLLNGRQQDLVMAEMVFALADEYHGGTLDNLSRKAVKETAAQLGIELAYLSS